MLHIEFWKMKKIEVFHSFTVSCSPKSHLFCCFLFHNFFFEKKKLIKNLNSVLLEKK